MHRTATVPRHQRPWSATIGIRAVAVTPEAKRFVRRLVELGIGFFVLSAVCWHRQGPSVVDLRLLHGYRPHNGAVHDLATAVSLIAAPVTVVLLGLGAAAFVAIRHHDRVSAIALASAPAVAGVIEAAMKIIVARPRPITAVLSGEAGNGFPSGHTAGFTALALPMAAAFSSMYMGAHSVKRRRVITAFGIAAIGSVAVGVSRVLVGAHYPSDVLAGLLLGCGVADVTAFLACHAEQLIRRHTYRSWLGLPVRENKNLSADPAS